MSRTVKRDWVAIIANVGVILGLVFVGLEVKNSRDSAQADIAVAFAGWKDINIARMDPQIGAILAKSYGLWNEDGWEQSLQDGRDALTEAEAQTYEGYLWANLDQFRMSHHLFKAGVLPETEYAHMRHTAASEYINAPWALNWLFIDAYASPGVQEHLAELRREVKRIIQYCRENNHAPRCHWEGPWDRLSQ